MIHLHVHSPYSLLDGFGESKKYIDRALELGQNALAITDHGVLFGIYDHYKECIEKNIKPIIGCEVYVTPDHTHKNKKELDELAFDNCHLVLLAKDNEGLQNLFELISISQLKGFYYKPRVDKELLRRYSSGIIALSACLAGEIPQLILRGAIEEAKQTITEYKSIFSNFYLEVQPNNIPEQAIVNNMLYQLSEETNTPLVVTCDCHYVRQEEGVYHKQFIKLGMGSKNEAWDEIWTSVYSDTWMKSDQEVLAMGIPQEAIDNTHAIAEMCNVTIDTNDVHMPIFQVPEEYTLDSYLIHLVHNGLFSLTLEEEIDLDAYLDRVEYELEIIINKGYSGYFLIVRDIVLEASRRAHVGPGRGSAAGCLVSYLIGITKIDPIKHGLLFERFLNPERPSLPDIDIDIDSNIRQDIIDYISDKYGAENVCQIITFGTLQSRLALKDAAHVLGVDYDLVNNITKELPTPPQDGSKYTIEDAIRDNPNIAKVADEHKNMFELAIQFEGIPRHAGIHAAGIVIAPDKLTKYVPLARGKKEEVVSQFSKDILEELGLVKIDLLGLKTLSVIGQTLKLIRENQDIEVKIDRISLENPKTLALLSSGKTNGVFQLESPGMQSIFKKVNKVTFDTLVAGVAMYRPGPMQQIDKYISAVNGYSAVEYIVPELEPILQDTYGIIIYQEQTMRIATDLAGFTPGQSDMLRKAIGKKKAEVMNPELDKLLNGSQEENIPGMLAKGIPQIEAERIVEMIRSFASYGFNLSHACSYATLSFETAYLKVHYPLEYMCALLNVYSGDKDLLQKYLEEAREMGILLLPPNINLSKVGFSILDGAILYGLEPIKGMGVDSSKLLVANQPFNSLEEITKLPKSIISKKVLTALTFSGALSPLSNASRAQIFQELLDLREDTKSKSPVSNKKEEYSMENDLLKTTFTEHILEGIATRTNWSNISQYQDTTLFCIIISVKKIKQKDGRPMCYLGVDTLEGPRNFTVFADVYEKIEEALKKDLIIKASIRQNIYKEKINYIVKKIKILKKYNKEG